MSAIEAVSFQRVLITGAAGFIGSHLVDRCLAMGCEVVGVDCFDDFYDEDIKRSNVRSALAHPKFTLAECDIRDRAAMHRLLVQGERFDVVVHLAARAGVRPSLADPALYFDVNVQGTLSLLEALRERSQTRLVLASSSSVYGGLTHTPFREDDELSQPVSPYAASKKAMEVLAYTYHHLHGIPMSLLRFFTVYGPRQRPDMAICSFTKKLRAGKPIVMFGAGDSARDYTYVDDIIDGVVAAMERTVDYRIYNLGESQTTKLKDLIRLLGEAVGCKPVVETKSMQPGDVLITYADVHRAKSELGYRPKTLVRDGLKKYVAWLEAEEAAPAPEKVARAGS